MNSELTLQLHDYTFFPYERDLARREVEALVGKKFTANAREFRVQSPWNKQNLWKLTYFARYENGHGTRETLQRLLESSHHSTLGRSQRRQSTRYSVHGLHEYKGKFNPQLAHALLNIFGADKRHHILDPFCGSGTTLVEAAHLGISGTGFDMNPLAVFVANTKINALWNDITTLRSDIQKVLCKANRGNAGRAVPDARYKYLQKWFTPEILADLERLRDAILEIGEPSSSLFLTTASDLLRDWSLQEPADLRIRRRQSPLPDKPFIEAWTEVVKERASIIENLRQYLPSSRLSSSARLVDSRNNASNRDIKRKFDFVITSPPYATALPYIDTQRLSLVWLGLIEPGKIRELDADVLGSREVISGRQQLGLSLVENAHDLPAEALRFCKKLSASLASSDGFRRQAMPMLLYRYLAGMKLTFENLYRLVRKGGKMSWVVGVNQTRLGGMPIIIDTPALLNSIASQSGFIVEEPIPLQTYQRYGLHQQNSIRQETVLIFRR